MQQVTQLTCAHVHSSQFAASCSNTGTVRALPDAQLGAERPVMPAFAEEIYTLFKGTGAEMIGHWPTDGYQHEDSKVAHECYELRMCNWMCPIFSCRV
jgi:hypothetical protein